MHDSMSVEVALLEDAISGFLDKDLAHEGLSQDRIGQLESR